MIRYVGKNYFKEYFGFTEKNYYKKYLVEANLLIFFQSLNVVYGYMETYAYNWVKTGKASDEDKLKKMYVPENEYLEMIREKGHAYGDDFNTNYNDCYNKFIDGTFFFQKIKCQKILSEQLELNTSNLKNEMDVHRIRKIIILRWFQAFEPFIEKNKSLSKLFTFGGYASNLFELWYSVNLLFKRDKEFENSHLYPIIDKIKFSGFFDTYKTKVII